MELSDRPQVDIGLAGSGLHVNAEVGRLLPFGEWTTKILGDSRRLATIRKRNSTVLNPSKVSASGSRVQLQGVSEHQLREEGPIGAETRLSYALVDSLVAREEVDNSIDGLALVLLIRIKANLDGHQSVFMAMLSSRARARAFALTASLSENPSSRKITTRCPRLRSDSTLSSL